MTVVDRPALQEWRRHVEQKRRLAEDLAASKILPGCSGVDDLLDRLERMVLSDPHRARRVYFAWRRACE